MRPRVVALALTLVLATAGCATLDAPHASEGADVVASTPLLAEMAQSLLGDDAAIETLVPRAGDPHLFDLAAVDPSDVEGAGLVVVNGGGLEPGLDEFVAGVADLDDPPRVFDAMEHVAEPVVTPEGFDEPHFWHDPDEAAAVARSLATEMVRAGLGDAEEVERAARALTLELAGAKFEAGELLDAVPERRRGLVTHHEFFRYFARAYGFTVIGTVVPGPSSAGETSVSNESVLSRTIEDRDVCAIFTSAVSGESLSGVVAEETAREVAVVEVFAETLPADATLVDAVLANARTVAQTLTAC